MTLDNAELIAKVVRDLRTGNIVVLAEDIEERVRDKWTEILASSDQIVDVTKIYHQFVDDPKGVRLYEDHTFLPVWDDALICYVNDHGNVHVCHTMTVPADVVSPWTSTQEHVIDWERAKWVTTAVVYIGGWAGYGTDEAQTVPTYGPVHAWAIVHDEDGTIQDIRWVHITKESPRDMWDNMLICLLKAYDFMSCVNVEAGEPLRHRAERRRIQRYIGETRISEIRVRPISKSRSQGETYFPGDFTVPLHTVRGHFAHYGEQYGRKLLFGKYAGKFFVPSHARGDETAGKREHNYTIDPEGETA